MLVKFLQLSEPGARWCLLESNIISDNSRLKLKPVFQTILSICGSILMLSVMQPPRRRSFSKLSADDSHFCFFISSAKYIFANYTFATIDKRTLTLQKCWYEKCFDSKIFVFSQNMTFSDWTSLNFWRERF